MRPRQNDPKRSELLCGIRLFRAVHAVSVALDNDSEEMQSLHLAETSTYYIDYGSGDAASVAWDDGGLVAVAFDHEDERNFIEEEVLPEPMRWMWGLPRPLLPLAHKALSPMVLHGEAGPAPMITAAAWTTAEALQSDDPWPEFLAHGGVLLPIFSTPEEAMWGEYDLKGIAKLEEAQAALCVALSRPERAALPSPGEERILFRGAKPDAAEAARRILRSLGLS